MVDKAKNSNNKIEVGGFFSTDLTIYKGEEHIDAYVSQQTDEGYSYLAASDYPEIGYEHTIEEGKKFLVQYKGTSFLLDQAGLTLNFNEDTELLAEIDYDSWQMNYQGIRYNSDFAFTQINGEDIYLSDIKTMIDKDIPLNEARIINGNAPVSVGITSQDIRDARIGLIAGVITVPGIAATFMGVEDEYNKINLDPLRYASKVTNVTSPREIVKDKMIEAFVGGALRGLGKPIPIGYARFADGLWDLATTDESEEEVAKIQELIEIAQEEYFELKRDQAFGTIVGRTGASLSNTRLFDSIAAMGNKFGQSKIDMLKAADPSGKIVPIAEETAKAARNEARKLMKDAYEEAYKLAKKADLSNSDARKAARMAAEATEKAAIQATHKSMQAADNTNDMLKAIRYSADEVSAGIGKIVGQVHKAADIAKSTSIGQKISNAASWVADSKLGKFVKGGGKYVLKPLAVIAPVFDYTEGVATAHEGLTELESAKQTDGDADDKSAKSKTLNGVVIGSFGGAAAIATGVAMTGVLGGAGGIAGALAMASNPVGIVVGIGLLGNFGVKYFTGKSITERGADLIFGVNNEDKTEKTKEANPKRKTKEKEDIEKFEGIEKVKEKTGIKDAYQDLVNFAKADDLTPDRIQELKTMSESKDFDGVGVHITKHKGKTKVKIHEYRVHENHDDKRSTTIKFGKDNKEIPIAENTISTEEFLENNFADINLTNNYDVAPMVLAPESLENVETSEEIVSLDNSIKVTDISFEMGTSLTDNYSPATIFEAQDFERTVTKSGWVKDPNVLAMQKKLFPDNPEEWDGLLGARTMSALEKAGCNGCLEGGYMGDFEKLLDAAKAGNQSIFRQNSKAIADAFVNSKESIAIALTTSEMGEELTATHEEIAAIQDFEAPPIETSVMRSANRNDKSTRFNFPVGMKV